MGIKQKLVIKCSIRDIKQRLGLTGDADVFMSLELWINTARWGLLCGVLGENKKAKK